jgi:hypothetical protein
VGADRGEVWILALWRGRMGGQRLAPMLERGGLGEKLMVPMSAAVVSDGFPTHVERALPARQRRGGCRFPPVDIMSCPGESEWGPDTAIGSG